MDKDRWEQINSIFSEALDQSADERSRFLAEACGDDHQLREEVETLLLADENATNEFLKPSTVNVKSTVASPQEDDPRIGEQIGNYEIKRPIGKGGMGNVYLAVRKQGFQQRVAMKILKRGMDSDEILRRFNTEIRVQAALSKHPNIVGIIDAGTTDDGLPYFVMEYVEGEPIDTYCDREKLTIRERLMLMQHVCAAVQFAHQHTVIHRDLKPGNVMVTTDGEVRLIDFGIAKLTTPELTDATATPTRTTMRMLTPEYASPEQVRGDPITTASDVYSLGVLLYELLTDEKPYRPRSSSIPHLEQMVCETEPARPSTTAPKELQKTLTGDLDNLVLKTLRKEPSRRYASVEQLSDDIRRYLDGEPVAARPINKLERFWRTCQRQPLVASLFFSVLISSIFGVWHLTFVSQDLVEKTALRAAAHEAIVLEQAHISYAAEVQKLSAILEKQVADPKAEKLAPPAIFAKELAEKIGKDQDQTGQVVSRIFDDSNMYARLYSRYPFRPQEAATDEVPTAQMDDFETRALAFVEQHPDEPYYSFEEEYRVGNQTFRPALRYVQARTMAKTCVECHNKPEIASRNEHLGKWKVGEVGGAVEIIHPLDGDTRRVRRELQSSFLLMSIIAVSLLILSAAALTIGKRRN